MRLVNPALHREPPSPQLAGAEQSASVDICGICGYPHPHAPWRGCLATLVAQATLVEPDVSMPWPPREKHCCGYCREHHILTIEMCNPNAAVFHEPPVRYGRCDRCGNSHTVGPCPQVTGEREYRQRAHLIEQSVRFAGTWPVGSMHSLSNPLVVNLKEWQALLKAHDPSYPAEQCGKCGPFLYSVRAAFNRLTHADPATSTQPAG